MPDEFWHHFCSGSDPADLRLPSDATLVGCRLIESFDSEADPGCCHTSRSSSSPPASDRYPDPNSEAPELIASAIGALT